MYDFLFPQRLRRLSYFFRAWILNAFLWAATNHIELITDFTPAEMLFVGGTLLILIYGVLFVYLPRLRDCGVPAWTLLFALIPYVSSVYGILLLFKRSRLFYGTTPVEKTTPEVITVAGSNCDACGERLVFASDGVVTPEGKVLCNKCRAKQEAPTN